jgi:hypothetical protein
LAKTLIDKYLEAGEIINSKIKKGDNFDFDQFQATLILIKSKISADFLETINKEQTSKVNDEVLDRAIKIREERKRTNKVKDKKVRDLRVYYNGFPNKALYPYDFQYVEIFRNLLRRSDLLCPTYHHLYVQASKTFEDGLRSSFSIEDWYVNGVSVLDYDKYLKGSESEKEQIVIELISNGLLDIATVDNLDASIIKSITDKVKSTGLETELIFERIENAHHALTITYLSRSMEEQCPIFFNVLDKKANRTNKIQIGRADNFQIYFWLQKVTLTRNKIKVKSSGSIEADVTLRRTTKAICNGWVKCKYKVLSSLLRLVTVDRYVFKSQPLQIAKRCSKNKTQEDGRVQIRFTIAEFYLVAIGLIPLIFAMIFYFTKAPIPIYFPLGLYPILYFILVYILSNQSDKFYTDLKELETKAK